MYYPVIKDGSGTSPMIFPLKPPWSQDVVLQSVEVSFEGDGGMVRVKDIEINGRFDVRGRAESCCDCHVDGFWADFGLKSYSDL